MSLSGTTNTYLPPTLDGLNIIEADAIYINGIPIDTENLVPYTGASKNVNLGIFNFQTLGSISAKQHILPLFGSTIMTSPTTSSIFYADAWKLNNTVQISSLGGGSFLSTSYLHITDVSNTSTLLTLQSDGIADFANTKVRVSTMASNVYDVVNLSTLTSAVAFIENVNALNYVPYTNALQDLNMMGSTITTLGQINAGALRITSSISNADYTLSVNPYDQLEFTNLSNGNILKTDGASVFLPTGGNLYGSATTYSNDLQLSGTSYFAYGTGQQWGTNLNGSGEYEIQDDAGVMRMRLSKTGGMTISTISITNVPSLTPSLALGLNGGGQVVSFAVPTTSGLVPYVGATANLQLGSNSLIANTARFTSVVSATPSLALGVDVSGNLNTFAVPSATNLLPLNNTWTGTNTYNAGIQIAAGSLGVATGNIVKQSMTALSYTQITGGNATNSPYMEYCFGGYRRGYIGNATATDFFIVAENNAQLSVDVGGARRMSITTGGNTIMATPLLEVNNTLTTTSNNPSFTLRNSVANPSIFHVIQKTIGSGAYHSLVQAGDTLFLSMDQQNGVTGANGIVIAGWNQTAGLRIGPSLTNISGPLTVSGDITTTAPKFIATSTIANINGGTSSTVPNGWMSAGSLTLGDNLKNYGGGLIGWNSNTAGLLLECAANTEIAVHDAGDRVASFMYYSGNLFTIGRDMGWGVSQVYIPGICNIATLTVGYARYLYSPETAGATYGSMAVKGTGRNGWAGYSIYNDSNQQVSFMMDNGVQSHGIYNATASSWTLYSDVANGITYLQNRAGATPISFGPGSWNTGGGGYTLISRELGNTTSALAFGTSPGRAVIISLTAGVVWNELILSGGTIYTSCFGTINNYTNGGGWVYVSDKRVKKDIKDIKTARSLERIMALKPKTYKKIYHPEKTNTPIPQEVIDADHIGFLAQDVMETNPHCVSEWVDDNCVCDGDDGKRLGIAYSDINVHMVGAIQELKKQNDAQQNEIADLKAYKTLSEERFEKMGRLIADQQKLLEFLMSKLK